VFARTYTPGGSWGPWSSLGGGCAANPVAVVYGNQLVAACRRSQPGLQPQPTRHPAAADTVPARPGPPTQGVRVYGATLLPS
jgi:hypothetical protein